MAIKFFLPVQAQELLERRAADRAALILSPQIGSLKASIDDIKTQMQTQSADIKAQIADIKAEIGKMSERFYNWFLWGAGGCIAAVGAFLTSTKYSFSCPLLPDQNGLRSLLAVVLLLPLCCRSMRNSTTARRRRAPPRVCCTPSCDHLAALRLSRPSAADR